jgi:TetR/AcrR family transcriptional regulator
MVSQDVGRQEIVASASRARLLKAAAAEFAARGFDGAKVDRIAARARVNKAMVYYHFENKAALYREILMDVFGAAARAVAAVPAAGGTPEAQLRAFIAAVSSGAVSRPHFPSIWLRELAEGGRHLDAAILAEVGRVLATLAGILQQGVKAGRFRPVHPLIVQMGIVAPLLLFSASAPARERLKHKVAAPVTGLAREAVLAYVQDATLAAISRRTDA